jgi:hypothetical protein
MSKAKKKAAPKKRGTYEKPVVTKGGFMDLIGAVVKDANKKSAPKKKATE